MPHDCAGPAVSRVKFGIHESCPGRPIMDQGMAMSEMVERVARAIALSMGGRIVGPGQSRATREFGWSNDGGHFTKFVDAHWNEYVSAAELALEAMRNPTEAMLEAGPAEPYMDREVWAKMIDEALK